ncbi:hypothetical protein B0H15DRAFT_953651 [Mycena belliarum]|uniref:Uncharacterized protein n=1 Tax=Mycena belliarum TaxID=1033014 RepID=A0AAD6TVX3_9AGAR|nr:hypothetical protein B0H15DRAFT_953651 [Mycena belliae]
MADREKRAASTARPGDVVNKAKWSYRTREQVEADARQKEQDKAAKVAQAAAKKKAGLHRAAAAQEKIRQEDEQSRAAAARPDLVTAQLKHPVDTIAQRKKAASVSPALAAPQSALTSDADVGMEEPPVADAERSEDEPMDDDEDGSGGYDPEIEGSRSADSGSEDKSEPESREDQGTDDEDERAIAEFKQALREKRKKQETHQGKQPAKPRTKPKKGHLRAEIAETQEELPAPRPEKRKPVVELEQSTQPRKKPKAAAGGLVPGWQKAVGVKPAPKKSATSWNRSLALSRASSTTSAASQLTYGCLRRCHRARAFHVQRRTYPWAARATSYLPPIKTLSLKQWREIFSLSNAFHTIREKNTGDILMESASDGNSSEGSDWVDPRSRVVVSDDESDEDGIADEPEDAAGDEPRNVDDHEPVAALDDSA